MKSIYKYQPHFEGEMLVEVPLGAELLSIQYQHDVLCFWFMVDPRLTATVARKFYVFGTGHPMSEQQASMRYITTVQEARGYLVWHIFEPDA